MEYPNYNTRNALEIISYQLHRQIKSNKTRNTQEFENDFNESVPVLTLFTTWTNSEEKNFARRNTTVSN